MQQMSITDVIREQTWIEIDVDTLKRALRKKKKNDKNERVKKALKRKEKICQ